jgi:adenylate kinase
VIKAKYGVVHLSTGDILRAAVKEGTELGKQAKAFMDGGKLVPDELIIGVVAERLNQPDCKAHGWLLDGFPRTKAQADALKSAGHTPDCFILLDVPEEVLVERVSGRRTDPVTGKIYHLRFSPPESPEIAARLFQRSDDTEEKIKIRYREFQSHITAIRSSYEDRLVHVDGTAAQKEVARAVVRGLTRVKIEKNGGVSQQAVADLVAGLLELDERIAENSHKFAEEFQRLVSPTLQQFK